MSAAPSKWDDLWVRMASAAALLAIGGVEIWLGGLWFRVFVGVIVAVMIWELARMLTGTGQGAARQVAALAGVVTAVAPMLPGLWGLAALLGVVVAGSSLLPDRRKTWVIYAPLILLAGDSLIWVRDDLGVAALLWLLCVVVASDVCGYFAGRLLGGPKFWPRFSPKKTWTGTVAGWIGAGGVGLAFAPILHSAFAMPLSPVFAAVFSMLVALAAQMGDIAESAIKRRAGVKDSSSLIPGHGGLLDRFDALIGASVLVLVLGIWA